MNRRMSGSMVALTGLLVWVFSAGIVPVASANAALDRELRVLDECRQQNSRIHREAMQLHQRAMRAIGDQVSPQDRQQLIQLQPRLIELERRLRSRDLTLSECRDNINGALIDVHRVVADIVARIPTRKAH